MQKETKLQSENREGVLWAFHADSDIFMSALGDRSAPGLGCCASFFFGPPRKATQCTLHVPRTQHATCKYFRCTYAVDLQHHVPRPVCCTCMLHGPWCPLTTQQHIVNTAVFLGPLHFVHLFACVWGISVGALGINVYQPLRTVHQGGTPTETRILLLAVWYALKKTSNLPQVPEAQGHRGTGILRGGQKCRERTTGEAAQQNLSHSRGKINVQLDQPWWT